MPGFSVPLRGHSLLPGNLVVQIRGIPADAHHRTFQLQRIPPMRGRHRLDTMVPREPRSVGRMRGRERALDTPTRFSRSENTANDLFWRAVIAATRRASTRPDSVGTRLLATWRLT